MALNTLEEMIKFGKRWLQDHPEGKDHMDKAYFAYHAKHPNIDWGAHEFSSSLRTDRCAKCNRTRELVRWDDLPPKCAGWKEPVDVVGILQKEEQRFFKMVKEAEKLVPKIIKQRGLSGETLSFLHHTHGLDPEIVGCLVEIPEEMYKTYNEAWEQHKRTGGSFKGA